MIKSRLALLTLSIPLILAGCGQNDGQFSGHPNSIAKVVQKDKQTGKQQATYDSIDMQNKDYQLLDQQTIKNALNRDQISSARAQNANKKLRFTGKIIAIGRVKNNSRTLVVASKHRNYLVFAKELMIKNLKVNNLVTVYGNGLALITNQDQQLGLDAKLINSNTLIFNANQFVKK